MEESTLFGTMQRCTSTPVISKTQETLNSTTPMFSIFNKDASISSTQSGSSTKTSSMDIPSSASYVRRKKAGNKITKYIDKVSKSEVESITRKLGRLFFGCNIPLSVVKSQLFREYIEILRPAFIPHLPSWKKLSTTILDDVHEAVIKQTKFLNEEDCVLLIDGWKNSSANKKTVVTMIQAGEKKTFSKHLI